MPRLTCCYSVGVLLCAITASGRAQSFATAEVIGQDYAFRAPTTLRPGLTAFSFKNEGKVFHEVALVRLKPGVVLDSLLKAEPATRRTMQEYGGILIAGPGEAPLGRLLIDLTPGTYLLICNFRDATVPSISRSACSASSWSSRSWPATREGPMLS